MRLWCTKFSMKSHFVQPVDRWYNHPKILSEKMKRMWKFVLEKSVL